jgi:tetratricopeptide (TPR) repeat protein
MINMKKFLIVIFLLQAYLLGVMAQRPAPNDSLTPEKAIQYYQSILDRNKNSNFATYGMATAYFVKGDYKNAIKYSKQNIKNENEYKAECYLIYAVATDRIGFSGDAAKEFEKAIKVFPKNDQLYYQYALTCYKTREFDKALDLVNKSITLQPLFADVHYLNGCLLFESSNSKQAVGAFLYALLLDNDSIRSQQAIIFIHEFIGHKQNGIGIPYYQKRMAIAGVDNILKNYIPIKTSERFYKELKTELLEVSIESYLEAEGKEMGMYSKLFDSMAANNLTKAFSHYVLRGLGADYMNRWYKVNAQPLKAFADFLDKNLPGI